MNNMNRKIIKVCEKYFICEKSNGIEYGKSFTGYPFEPYKEKEIIDDSHAFLVDAKGIVWVLEDFGEGLCFSRPCLKLCLDYIMRNSKKYSLLTFSELMDQIGVDDPRAKIYDEEQSKRKIN